MSFMTESPFVMVHEQQTRSPVVTTVLHRLQPALRPSVRKHLLKVDSSRNTPLRAVHLTQYVHNVKSA